MRFKDIPDNTITLTCFRINCVKKNGTRSNNKTFEAEGSSKKVFIHLRIVEKG